MLIKFKKPDPRAGDTVRMDSSLGQRFIDMGHADRVAETSEATPAIAAKTEPAVKPDGAPASTQEDGSNGSQGGTDADAALKAAALEFIVGNVPDVIARIDGADKAVLAAALEAENASEKPRKGVVDALTAAIAAPQA